MRRDSSIDKQLMFWTLKAPLVAWSDVLAPPLAAEANGTPLGMTWRMTEMERGSHRISCECFSACYVLGIKKM